MNTHTNGTADAAPLFTGATTPLSNLGASRAEALADAYDDLLVAALTEKLDGLMDGGNRHDLDADPGCRTGGDGVGTDAHAVVEQTTPEWRIRWVIAQQDGGLVVRDLHIETLARATPQGGITATMLRKLSPANVVRDAAADMPDPFTARVIEQISQQAQAEVEQRPIRRGRPPLSDEHLARVALAYLDELRAGRGVWRRMSRRFDRTPEAMRDQVRKARERGFLTEAAGAGQRGGEPGPALLAYIENDTGDPS